MRTLRVPLVVLCVLLATVLAACGGGSGGGGSAPADASLLDGTYFMWGMSAQDGMPDEANTLWAVATADGAGSIDATFGQNLAGSVSGPIMAPTLTYTVAGNRSTTITEGMSLGLAGWTNADGTVALTGSVLSASDPLLLGLVKLGSGFGDADLAGDWFMCIYLVAGGSAFSYWGTATWNAVGGGMASLGGNEEGSIGAVPGVLMLGSVASNGQLTMNIDGLTLDGAMHASRNLVIATGSTTDTQDPFLAVFVRKTSGASAATLSGTYQIIGLERDGGGFSTLTGSIVANGAGSLTATLTHNTDGLVSNSGPDIAAYTAAADGALVVNPMSDELIGGFSAGGTFAVVAGPNTAMSEPGLYVLMRR